MPNIQNPDALNAVKTLPIMNAKSLIEATLQDLTPLGRVLSGKGWVNPLPPTATRSEPFVEKVGTAYCLVINYSGDVHVTFALTSEFMSTTMEIAMSAFQSMGDAMVSTAPTVNVQPGTRVELIGEPIGVTLNESTGVIVGPSQWEGYVVVRLDRPGIYHNADGTDEPIDEIVEAPDNLSFPSQEN